MFKNKIKSSVKIILSNQQLKFLSSKYYKLQLLYIYLNIKRINIYALNSIQLKKKNDKNTVLCILCSI